MRIFYHSTKLCFVNSILSEGLLKKYSTLWVGCGGAIYLGETPEDAKGFGEVLLTVDTEGLECCRLSEWEVICWDNIPKDRIKVYEKHKSWKNRSKKYKKMIKYLKDK